MENLPTYILLYEYLTSDEQNRVDPSDPDALEEAKNDE